MLHQLKAAHTILSAEVDKTEKVYNNTQFGNPLFDSIQTEYYKAIDKLIDNDKKLLKEIDPQKFKQIEFLFEPDLRKYHQMKVLAILRNMKF